MGCGDGKKYHVKWANLREELECYYGAGHNLSRGPVEVRPQKQEEIHDTPAIAPSSDNLATNPEFPVLMKMMAEKMVYPI